MILNQKIVTREIVGARKSFKCELEYSQAEETVRG